MDPLTGAIIGGSLLSGAASIFGANKSAKAATDAANISSQEAGRQFDLTRQDTAPYRSIGTGALARLAALYGIPLALSAPAAAVAPQAVAGPQVSESRAADEAQLKAYQALEDNNGIVTPWAIKKPIIDRLNASQPVAAAPASPIPAQAAQPADTMPSPDMSGFFTSPEYQFNRDETQKAIDHSLVARGKALSGQGLKEGMRYASGLASNEFGNYYSRLANLAGLGSAGVNTSASAGANAAGQIGNAALNAGNVRASSYQNMAQGVNNAVQGGISNYLIAKYSK